MKWGLGAVLSVVIWLAAGSVAAQDLSGLARLLPGQSRIADQGIGIEVDLAISQPVPWRVRVLDAPPRVVMDFREVDFVGLAGVPQQTALLADLRAGVFRAGWSRLVLVLKTPMLVETAFMQTGDPATIHLTLRPATEREFALQAARPEPADWAMPVAADLPTAPERPDDGRMVVVLDPGHGGIDPGAERSEGNEATLVLTFARELKELLLRDGRFVVVMTRNEDVFVSLESRISIAHQARADVFLALHADALAEGEATGTTIYSLSAEASDAAGATLAERHNRDDLLAGIDLSQQDDLVAEVLMDMARTATTPRTARLADALQASIIAAGIKMHQRPHQEASFSVLKSPDIPSLLLELGFMSSDRDFARLSDPDWRATMAQALRDGLLAWGKDDAARTALPTQP